MNNFKPLEVVGRGSETQLRVAENYIYSAPLRVNIERRLYSGIPAINEPMLG